MDSFASPATDVAGVAVQCVTCCIHLIFKLQESDVMGVVLSLMVSGVAEGKLCFKKVLKGYLKPVGDSPRTTVFCFLPAWLTCMMHLTDAHANRSMRISV